MPLYEYRCEQDGTVIELMRPMADADAPVEDPAGKGRVFVRTFSTFAPVGGGASARGAGASLPVSGGCCPCGKNRGACSN